MSARFLLPLALLLSAAPTPVVADEAEPRATLVAQYDLVHADGRELDGWRRLRPGLDLKAGVTRLRMEYDIEAKRWTHAWMELDFGAGRRLRAGQFKPPAGLEELGSGHLQPFMERSASRALASSGRRLGVQWQQSLGPLVAQGLIGGKSLDRAPDGRLFAGRLFSQDARRHLGFSLSRELSRRNSGRLVFRPEIGLIEGGVDSGRVEDVRRLDRAGLEAAWLSGPWTLSAEALWARLDRRSEDDIAGSGGYLSATWTANGDGRRLRGGTLVAPAAVGRTVYELGLRVAFADLDLPGRDDGRSESLTLGVNAWLPFGGAIMLNHVRVRVHHGAERSDRGITALRLGWWF